MKSLDRVSVTLPSLFHSSLLPGSTDKRCQLGEIDAKFHEVMLKKCGQYSRDLRRMGLVGQKWKERTNS